MISYDLEGAINHGMTSLPLYPFKQTSIKKPVNKLMFVEEQTSKRRDEASDPSGNVVPDGRWDSYERSINDSSQKKVRCRVALFGHTARQWRNANSKLEGNVRDYAGIEQLLVLANMESINAEFIHMGLSQGERLKGLNQIAIRQMQILTSSNRKAMPGAREE